MAAAAGACDRLASLLAYPRPGYRERAEECARELAGEHPGTEGFLRPFMEMVRETTPTGLEELYTATFDINPVCCLEVGWQLFGEEYERGAFLVRMRHLLAECGVPESTELPDHLEHVLAAMERLPLERARELAGSAVLPALGKMLKGLEGKANPFENVLKAVEAVVRERYAAY